MGVFKTADGRTLVGIGQQDGNEYSGFNGWRDCVIQLTASGATENSVKYLNAIKDYAIAHNAKGESIMPPNLSIWISNNGATTAVQADDIAVDGANVTICGIKWNGTVWDYTDAGKGGGSGGDSQEPLVLTAVPDSEQNPFSGVAVGATRDEIVAAWNAGRLIRLKLAATELAFSLANNFTASNAALVAYFMYKVGNNQFFCRGILELKASALTYTVTMFSGLTPVTN